MKRNDACMVHRRTMAKEAIRAEEAKGAATTQ
jgi:hypothetical protein